jgi:16S rRNA (guanine966-N2)-methyltransferase
LKLLLRGFGKMKITGGTLKNRVVSIPKQEWVRPTSSRVREAVFSIVGQDLRGISFLDAYGGSGIMAIEAYSRGADPVTICEKNMHVQAYIKKNIVSLNVSINLQKRGVEGIIENGTWDIVFLDPPYADNVDLKLINTFFSSAKQFLIHETDRKNSLLEIPANWKLWKMKVYGGTRLSIFSLKE